MSAPAQEPGDHLPALQRLMDRLSAPDLTAAEAQDLRLRLEGLLAALDSAPPARRPEAARPAPFVGCVSGPCLAV